MALKKKEKNKKQVTCNKEAIDNTREWPDLPQQLINIIDKQSTLMQNLCYGGVTKLWRTPPRQCNPNATPWLQLSDVNDGKAQPFKPNISFRIGFLWYFSRRRPYQCPWKYHVGYSNELLVVRRATSSEFNLWHPVRGYYYYYNCIPNWDDRIPINRAILSFRDSNNRAMMILTGISQPAFVFCRITERQQGWIKQDCTIADPHCSNPAERHRYMQFTNGIGFKGKFFVLSLQGTLAVIEDVDSQPRITALGPKRAVPSVMSRHFREFLIESDGKILLVFLICRKSINVVDDVEVFQLDIAKLLWVKMESLGDRTLFLGTNCCMSVSASKVGCRSNYIYFTLLTIDGWWVYDMERGSISPGWSDASSTTKSPVWIEPTTDDQ